jgi:hypothetical protein
MKETEMSWAYSTHGKQTESQKRLVRNMRERDLSGDLSEDGTMILKWILKEEGVRMWGGFI